MFLIQPGQGIGFTGSREIAMALGGCEAAVIPPVIPPIPDPGGRGSGPTGGIQPQGYTKHQYDALLETRRKRILREDSDIIALIMAMLTNDLL